MYTESTRLPTIELLEVFHVGQMDPSLKGTFMRSSLEGNGLSVSLHPQEWTAIARLGGQPTWKLNCPGARFVDALSLTEAHWAAVTSWATKTGLLASTQALKLQWREGESADEMHERYTLHEISHPQFTENVTNAAKVVQACHDEIEELLDNDPGCGAKLTTVDVLKATPAMNARVGFDVDMSLAKDIALTLYTEDVLYNVGENGKDGDDGFCGVWWDEVLDVHALSAPRGVIHLKSLPLWQAQRLEPAREIRRQVRPPFRGPK